MRIPPARRVVPALLAGGVAIAAATAGVVALEDLLGLDDASAVYVVAVALVAIAVGTGGAVLAAILAVVVYDYLFTAPYHTLTVADPAELLELLLLLFVAVTVGELAALQRRRAEVAESREREARALFEVTGALAGRTSTTDALGAVVDTLAREARLRRAWIALGADDATERTVVDTGSEPPPRRPGTYVVLHRVGVGTEPTWTQVRGPLAGGSGANGPGMAPSERREPERHYRVRLEAAGRTLGSLWGLRATRDGPPDAAATRLLAVAADQVATALEQDRLQEEARQAEIARQSDTLKSALIESVSHDLRTPLASIRAYAGTLMDGDVHLDPGEARASAAAIDREARRLDRLVANLLDLGRIDGGALRAHREALDVEDMVSRAAELVRPAAGDREVVLDVPAGLVVDTDPVLLEEILVNLLENAVRHTPARTRVQVVAAAVGEATVRLTVEDAGPGVPPEALPHLFDKFYRVPGSRGASRPGTGIGLAVVRGLVGALDGTVRARAGRLGGLAIDVDLPAAPLPETMAAGSA